MALINLRNAMMAGKRLPYDAEVEYLQSTGTGSTLAWVDTGIPNTANIRVEATARCVATSQYNTIDLYVFGSGWGAARDDAYGIVYSDFWTNLGNCMLLTRGGTGGSFSPDMGTSITGDGQFHYFVYETNDSMSSITVDNGTPFVITTQRNVNGKTYGVFGPRDMDTSSGIAQIAQLKIYDANGVLVRDYIPVRKGTVGYLYDRVSGALFGNAGTGDFVLGPDVVPVEYIESHGTEWIDTGVVPTIATEVEATVMPTDQTGSKFVFGCRNARALNTYACLIQDNSRIGYYVGDGNFVYASGYSEVGAIHKYGIANGVFYRDGAVVSDACIGASLSAGNALALLALNTNGTYNQQFVGRLYSCAINNSSVPVRSFRPVRVGTDATSWEGAMMDVLSRRIYRNAGTGAFAYGNDLKYPIPA